MMGVADCIDNIAYEKYRPKLESMRTHLQDLSEDFDPVKVYWTYVRELKPSMSDVRGRHHYAWNIVRSHFRTLVDDLRYAQKSKISGILGSFAPKDMRG